ncbi:CAMK family protein kinase [Tritrichomonas foetus]|uniref:CAMK family protein kinase n=1 Tax=Tritrichomonas foetus TaxID=1144522 RepID=A0A1J4K6T4_9EUKA|nr:CAMK family protein kinase [Tritrichomonas foetus]|eukprot:OHT07177.1 CAMK family protein kinase [Tritrichomonas foetus]
MENLFPPSIGDYTFCGILGNGAFSIVSLAVNVKTNEYSACKIIPKQIITANSLEERFETEIRINQQLHHVGVVQILDLHKDERNFYIFMEYCPNGDFFQFIIKNNTLNEPLAAYCLLQILEGLKYIHKLGIAHRDMKPENILIDENGHLKISDFGLSRFVGKGGLVTTPCGSPCYASPECLSGYPYDGMTNDIWSCGVILYASLTGQLPWTKRNQKQLFDQIRKGDYKIPDCLSEECGSLISGLLTVDIGKRLTIDQALEHPFFKEVERTNPQGKPYPLISIRKVDCFLGMAEEEALITSEELERSRSSAEDGFVEVLKQINTQAQVVTINKKPPTKKKRHRVPIDYKYSKQRNTNSGQDQPTNVIPSQSMQGSLRPLNVPKNTKHAHSVMKPGLLRSNVKHIVKPKRGDNTYV